MIIHFLQTILKISEGTSQQTIQVLQEKGKKPQTKSYMWLYRTGNDEKHPIILYDYRPSGNGDHVVVYLKGFKGYVHWTDTPVTTNGPESPGSDAGLILLTP